MYMSFLLSNTSIFPPSQNTLMKLLSSCHQIITLLIWFPAYQALSCPTNCSTWVCGMCLCQISITDIVTCYFYQVYLISLEAALPLYPCVGYLL